MNMIYWTHPTRTVDIDYLVRPILNMLGQSVEHTLKRSFRKLIESSWQLFALPAFMWYDLSDRYTFLI